MANNIDSPSAMQAQLIRLRKGLSAAAKKFDSHATDKKRIGVQLMLYELDYFLQNTLGTKNTVVLKPLTQLRYALIDLDRGKVVPLLTPTKVGQRPKDASGKESLRTFAAVAMELFIIGKMSRKPAADAVAKALFAMGYEYNPGTPFNAQRVEDWRDRMKAESPKEDAGAARFHRLVPQLKSMFPDDPIAAAKYLLQRIPITSPPDIPKKPPS